MVNFPYGEKLHRLPWFFKGPNRTTFSSAGVRSETLHASAVNEGKLLFSITNVDGVELSKWFLIEEMDIMDIG